MSTIKFVVATRYTESEFYEKAATGKSLRTYNHPFVRVRLFPENKRGLSEVFNIAIEESKADPAILIFCHDDIHLLDYFWSDQVLIGLEEFQILGVVGNKSRCPGQPSWAFINDQFHWDKRENLSGVIGHGTEFPPRLFSVFGPTCQQVKLLDGLFLATASQTLIESNLRFDERFDFHFYDVDFCRQAEVLGITCGTWAFSIMHESGGNFDPEVWHKSYLKYIEKWGD